VDVVSGPVGADVMPVLPSPGSGPPSLGLFVEDDVGSTARIRDAPDSAESTP
jgi:hypothetical protein